MVSRTNAHYPTCRFAKSGIPNREAITGNATIIQRVPASRVRLSLTPSPPDCWVCLDFLADVPANGSAVYRLTDSGPAKPIDKPVTVTDAAESITIDGGGLKLVVSKKSFAGLGRVFVGGRQVSAGGSLTIKGMDGKTYSSASDLADALGVGVSSAKNWSETVAAHRLIQVFLHDADKKKHPEKYR